MFSANNIPYQSLDKISIGIEICNWGQLTLKKDGKFYNYVNREVTDVIKLDKPFKGYSYWHNYTDSQITSLKALLLHLKGKYNIDLKYNDDIWKNYVKNVKDIKSRSKEELDEILKFAENRWEELKKEFEESIQEV